MADLIVKEEENSEEKSDFSKGYLTLPFDGDQFKDFITSLLGVPQKLTKKIKGDFEIHLKDLQNFNDLVSQRIEQQNNGMLIQFITVLYFSDGSSVRLGSYEELLTYNEIKPVTCVAAILNWDYLIHFVDKQIPEKQLIELIITTSNYQKKEAEPSLDFIGSVGQFEIGIYHTARSWAYDIEHLLAKQIESLIEVEKGLIKWIRKRQSAMSTVVFFIYVIISAIGTLIISQNYISIIQGEISLKLASNISIEEKLNILIVYISSGSSSIFFLKVSLFLLLSVFIALAFGEWIQELANNKKPSFLVLSRESLKYRDRIKKKYKRNWRIFFISFLISVVTGIIANFIFAYLVK